VIFILKFHSEEKIKLMIYHPGTSGSSGIERKERQFTLQWSILSGLLKKERKFSKSSGMKIMKYI